MESHSDQLIEISPLDITYLSDSTADEVGRVFIWQGRLLRAVRSAYAAEVEELVSCGLLQELHAAGLFLDVKMTAYQLLGYGLILEHEPVKAVTYPYEWSFSMFKDAAVAVLRVNQIARKFGYQTKDAHGYNVLFHGTHPVFVDLGSFIKVKPGYDGWQGYEQFLQYFYYPLKLWSDGNEFLARRVLSGAMLPLMPHESYLAYRIPWTRKLKGSVRRRIARLPLLLRRVANTPKQDVGRIWPGIKGVLLKWLRPVLAISGGTADFSGLLRKVQRIEMGESDSPWGSYQQQSGLVDASGHVRPSARFNRVAELIGRYKLADIIELAGNQGAFARYLMSEVAIKSLTCTDNDTHAVDALYRMMGTEQQVLTPAVLDFMAPVQLAETRSAHQRLRADAVLALAVTHHLLLSRRLAVDTVLSQICQYGKRYVFVEFMPLGLYDGRSAPDVPDWYHLDWFRAACERHFRIVVEEQLEKNRILIVGRLE